MPDHAHGGFYFKKPMFPEMLEAIYSNVIFWKIKIKF